MGNGQLKYISAMCYVDRTRVFAQLFCHKKPSNFLVDLSLTDQCCKDHSDLMVNYFLVIQNKRFANQNCRNILTLCISNDDSFS